MSEEYFCCVCYKNHQKDKVVLPCKGKHIICQEVYDKLTEHNINTCPLCREKIFDKPVYITFDQLMVLSGADTSLLDALILDLINYADVIGGERT